MTDRPHDAPASPSGENVRTTAQTELLQLMRQPLKIDLQSEGYSASSTPAELEERIRELSYRLKWLEALVTLTNEELLNTQLALKAAEQAAAAPKKK